MIFTSGMRPRALTLIVHFVYAVGNHFNTIVTVQDRLMRLSTILSTIPSPNLMLRYLSVDQKPNLAALLSQTIICCAWALKTLIRPHVMVLNIWTLHNCRYRYVVCIELI
jgi:hypothetical protein